LIYRLACMDAQNGCTAIAAQPNAWMPLPPPPSPSGIFVGKPSAFWALDNTKLTVAAVTDDRAVMVMTMVDAGGGQWVRAESISNDLAPDDPDPGVAIATYGFPGDVSFFARNQQGLLANETLRETYSSIGGMLVSPPGVVAITHTVI